jgi:adenylate cyclase
MSAPHAAARDLFRAALTAPVRLWRRYQRIGVTDALPPGEARYVRALNGIVLILPAVLWLQIPLAVRWFPATRYILAAIVIWPFLWQVVPLLNHLGRYTAARLFFSFSALTLVVFSATQAGPATPNYLNVIVVCVAGFIIFPPREIRWLVLVVIVTAAALAGLKWYDRAHTGVIDFSPAAVAVAGWTSTFLLFLMILAITVYHYRVVTEAERKLELEHQRSEGLLLNILPAAIAERLKQRQSPIADRIEDASILFADLIGFTELANRIPHERVVAILDALFSEFDRIGARHGLEKIKTMGDSYMLAGGVPQEIPGHHAAVAACALDMLAHVRGGPVPESPGLGVRIGIHCGPVVAGVICETKFAYDVWGDTVNTASRMESHAPPNHIQVSAAFYARTREAFRYAPRGTLEIKGKGVLETYLLESPMSEGAVEPAGACSA